MNFETAVANLGFRDLAGISPALNLILAGIAILALDAILPMRSKLLSAWIALLALAGSLFASLHRLAVGADISAFNHAVRMDPFANAFSAIICLASTLAVLSAPKYLKLREVHLAEYYALILFSVSGMVLFGASQDLLMMFLALETMSIPVYCLVGFTRTNVYSTEASMKYFLIGAFAAGFLVYGIALLYGAAGTVRIEDLAVGLDRAPGLFYSGMALLLVGFLFKIGAVPFHMWTPDAYEGAPTPVTTFMAEAVKAAPFGGMLKVLFVGFGFEEAMQVWQPVLIGIAVLTMTVGNLIALVQDDVKRMMGYSSIAHSGYILVGVAAAAELHSTDALAAVLYYLFIYVLMNAGTFGVLILFSSKDKDANHLDDLVGLGRERPWAAALMTVFLLSLTGIPPLGGFFGKFYIFSYAIQAGMIPLVVIAILNSVVSAYYYLKVIGAMYFREPEDGARAVFYFEGYSVFLIAMLWLSAAGVVYWGIQSETPLLLAEQATASLFKPAP
ncbi:NADH-quinone oxidoreductase subunit N [bacterium]|nr:NADH-quinone oxidoreductase subunit N [bacterium]